ncbi:MAG: ParA family protein [Acidobacteriota bacterium]
MKTIALYNLKGGVGKTASSVNLAHLASLAGYRTLIWDLDPQGASSFYFRIKPKIRGGRKALLGGKNDLESHIRGTDFEGLDLVPADFSYRKMDVDLGGLKKPAKRLARLLEPLADDYDLVFLDCPPSFSTTSESVFEAALALLMPMIPTTLSMRTLEQVRGHLARKGPASLPVWPFFCMVDRRKTMHRQTLEAAASLEGSEGYFEASIPYSSDIERMGLDRNPVTVFAPSGAGARAYLALWSQLESRLRTL